MICYKINQNILIDDNIKVPLEEGNENRQ
jgi:hypothetical protein